MLYFLLILFGTSVAFDEEVHSKYKTLHREEFVEYFNSLNFTWKVGRKGLGHVLKHCSLIHNNSTYPKITHDVNAHDLPGNFDARNKWAQCPSIGKIYNQQYCGSCWMFGTTTTATDRNCIHANVNNNLSEQDLSCCNNCFELGKLCDGGDPVRAFEFWIDNGLVSYDCLPYDYNALVNNQYCTKNCVNGNDYTKDKNYGSKVYTVADDENQIKAELFNNGPIQASFVVYSDITDYHQGVYVHKYGERKGYHSVRMIGYGEESGEKYWLIANSWGTEGGENGFYKIKQFQPELELEIRLYTVMPKSY